MKRTIRAGITGALLIGGVGGLTAIAGSGAGQPIASNDLGVDPTPFLDRSPFGTLELRTDPNGGLEIAVAEIGEDPVVVDLSPGKQDRCKVDLDAVGEYLGLEVVTASVSTDPDPDTGDRVLSTDPITPPSEVGLVDQGLGSREQNNCNRSNGRLEPGHAFVITLGSEFEDVVFDYGVLDIEAKFGADLFARTSLWGEVVETYDDDNLLPNTSDNDPDVQGSDNNLVQIGDEPEAMATMGPAEDDFDQLVILPTSDDDRGQISLEGGGDYATAGTSDDNRTVFHLVRSKTYEYSVVCYTDGDSVYDPNLDGTVKGVVETPDELDWLVDDDPTGESDYPQQTRLFRYAGKDAEGDQKPCPAIGANLSADTEGVLLEPSDESAFLRVELTWVIPAALVDLADGDPFARTIDVDGDGPLEPTDARYCDGFSGATGFDPAAPGDVTHPDDTPWCVISDVRELTQIEVIDPDDAENTILVDVVIQTQAWDGLGDPYWN